MVSLCIDDTDNHQVITDYENGCDVCTRCGLVVNDLVFGVNAPAAAAAAHTNYYYTPPGLLDNNNNHNNTSFMQGEHMWREFLMDSLAVIHQDCGFLVDRCIHRLSEAEQQGSILDGPLSLHQTVHRAMAAFLLWDTMNQDGHPRNPSTIASLMEVTRADMLRAERKLGIAPTPCPPSNYSMQLCSGQLGLGFRVANLIKKAVEEVDYLVRRPEVIVGATLFELTRVTSFNQVTVREIAQAVGCSVATISHTATHQLTARCRTVLQRGWENMNM